MFDIGFRLNGSEKRAQRIPIATPQEEARDKWRRNSSDIEIDSRSSRRGYWKEDKERLLHFQQAEGALTSWKQASMRHENE